MERNLRRLLIITILLVTPAWAIAQESEAIDSGAQAADQPPDDETTGKGKRVFRDKIVVTASRQEQESAQTPVPITVIDRAMIEQQQPEKMADLFKQIPGVEIDGEGPFRGVPVIRGFSSNRVLILVDGQRLNNARESTTFAGTQPGLVNLAQVERIEVLRGPASVQYGSDAIGGVINIITRQPDLGADEFTVSGDVAYEYGTASESNNARAYVSGSGDGFSFHLGASYQDADDYKASDDAKNDEALLQSGYVLPDGRVPNSGMEQRTFDGSVRFLTGSQGVFRLNMEVVRTDDIGFPGFDPAISGIDISFPNFDRDKVGMAWNSGPVLGLADVSLSGYYQQVDKESVRNFEFPGFFSRSFTRSEITSYGFNAQSIADTGRHHLSFGLDVYQDQVDDTSLSDSTFSQPSTEVAVPKSEQTGLGAYIEDQIAATDRLTVHAGLRGDTFKFKSEDDPDYTGEPFDVNDSAISGNLGVNFAVTPHVNLTGLVARGFRSPNLQERAFEGFASTGDTFILQNPDLDPEESLNYEAGFKVRYDRYYGGFNLFYNDVKDFITLEFLGPDPTNPMLELARFANLDEATIWGIEFELETIVADWWTVFTTAAYTKGDNDITGEPLPIIPPLKLLLGVRYQQPKWWAEASLRIVGDQDRLPRDDPRTEEGTVGFTEFDLRGGYDFDCGLGLLVSVENVADKLYAEPFNIRPEPGRNLRVLMRYRF